MEPFYGNLNELAFENNFYRKVIYTIPGSFQIVLMKISPKEEIGMEVHKKVTQTIQIVSGEGLAIVNNKRYILTDNTIIVIPPNTKHNIINTSTNKLLKLYTFYNPPEHKPTTTELYKDD